MPKTAKPAVNALTYRACVQKLAKAFKPRHVVEVGVYCGDLSRALAAIPSIESLTLVDPWLGGFCGRDQAYMDLIAMSVAFWSKTDPRVEIVRLPSVDAARRHPDISIDFWHLDGDHSYAAVEADLVAWWPKMRYGGLMTGDNFEIEDVAKAVRKFFGTDNIETQAKGRVWIARVRT